MNGQPRSVWCQEHRMLDYCVYAREQAAIRCEGDAMSDHSRRPITIKEAMADVVEGPSIENLKAFADEWSRLGRILKMQGEDKESKLVAEFAEKLADMLEPPVQEGPPYTSEQIDTAIRQFLDFGEESRGRCHHGYFSPGGWAYECLRWHRENWDKNE